MEVEEYKKESDKIIEKNQKDYERDLVESLMATRNNLYVATRNFEYAEDELIDYYLYKIKAEKAKYSYLLKKAKKNGIILDFLRDINFNDIKVV